LYVSAVLLISQSVNIKLTVSGAMKTKPHSCPFATMAKTLRDLLATVSASGQSAPLFLSYSLYTSFNVEMMIDENENGRKKRCV